MNCVTLDPWVFEKLVKLVMSDFRKKVKKSSVVRISISWLQNMLESEN